MNASSETRRRGFAEVGGYLALLGVVPLLWESLTALAGRDYVAGGLLVFAAAAIGHVGVELVALALGPAPRPARLSAELMAGEHDAGADEGEGGQ